MICNLDQSDEGGTDKTWLYFETNNLDDDVRMLSSQGIKFEHEPINQSWLWREARLKDPDSNQIILYRAGENRKNPPWRI